MGTGSERQPPGQTGGSNPGRSAPGASVTEVTPEERAARLAIKSLFETGLGVTAKDEDLSYVQFLVPREREPRLTAFVEDLQARAAELLISDIQISESTLDEVFLNSESRFDLVRSCPLVPPLLRLRLLTWRRQEKLCPFSASHSPSGPYLRRTSFFARLSLFSQSLHRPSSSPRAKRAVTLHCSSRTDGSTGWQSAQPSWRCPMPSAKRSRSSGSRMRMVSSWLRATPI